MSFERARVLTAMADLVEFYVSDLVERSGVREATVRTIVLRENRYVKVAETERSGKPGGQRRKYILRPGARDQILAELGNLDLAARADFASKLEAGVPDALLIAEHTLLSRIPPANFDAQRANLLTRARGQISAVTSLGITSSGASQVAGRLHAAEWLVQLIQQEERWSFSVETASDAFKQTRAELLNEFTRQVWPALLRLIGKNDEAGLLPAYVRRALESPLFAGLQLWEIAPPAAPGYVVVVDDPTDTVSGAADPVTASVIGFLDKAQVAYKVISLDSDEIYDGPAPDMVLLTMTCASDLANRQGHDDAADARFQKTISLFDAEVRRLPREIRWRDEAVVVDCVSNEMVRLAGAHRKRFVSLPDGDSVMDGDHLFGSYAAISTFARTARALESDQ